MKAKRMLSVMVSLAITSCCMHITASGQSPLFSWGENNWNLTNSKTVFGDSYLLTESDQTKLDQNLTNIERYMAYNQLLGGEFLGSCYGMAALSVLSCYDLMDDSQYTSGSDSLYMVSPSDEVLSLCNYYTALQFTDNIRQYTADSILTMTEEERLQQLIDNTEKGRPSLIAYFGDFNSSGGRYGHAVVACGMEYGTYEVFVPYVSNDLLIERSFSFNCRIRIYDNQAPDDEERYFYINTNDMSWQCNGAYSKENGTLSMVISDPNLLNANGLLSETTYDRSSAFKAILTSSAISSAYSLKKVVCKDGMYEITGADLSESTGYPVFLGEQAEPIQKNYILTDAESGYVMQIAGSEAVDLELNYEDCLFSVQASSVSDVMFHPNGLIKMVGNDCAYSLNMVFNTGNYDGEWYHIHLSGNANSISMKRKGNGYQILSDDFSDVTIVCESSQNEYTKTFSTDQTTVFLYENVNHSISLALDKDHDGIFETPFHGSNDFVKCDVNGDQVFSIADLVTLQKWLLNYDTTLLNWNAADLYRDNQLNCFDLCLMKRMLIQS